MIDPASAEYQEDVEDALEAEALAVEAAVIAVILHRIATMGEGATVSGMLAHAPADYREMADALRRGERDVSKAAAAIIDTMADANDRWAKGMYEAKGIEQTRKATAGIIEDGRERAQEAVSRAFGTKAVGLTVNGRFRPLRGAYTAIVSDAVMAVTNSKLDYNEAVGEACAKALSHMCDSGVKVRYESGAVRELYGAVRMNVMDGYRKTLQDARWAIGDEVGADMVEVSAHSMCAPDHLPYQGTRMTLLQFEHAQDRLERDIAGGLNCRHTVFRVLAESKPAYTKRRLDEMRRESERRVTVTGLAGEPLEMTAYQATQYQRQIEQRIRKLRLERGLAEREGLDVSGIARRTDELEAAYRKMSREADLTPKLERTDVFIPR